MPTQYSITIDIGPNIYKELITGGYKLCICKKVNGVYNVVWNGAPFLISGNLFQWNEIYSVFGSQTFDVNGHVHAETAVQPIQFNQTCLLDETFCNMNPATGTPDPTVPYFTVDNECTRLNIHVGVEETLSTGGGPQASTPIFLSEVVVPGDIELGPKVTLLLFFDLELDTATLFEKAVSHSVEVDYQPGQTSVQCLYNDQGQWVIEGAAQPRLGYKRDRGFFPERKPRF